MEFIKINVIGRGFLEMDGKGIAFKKENQQFRFCDVSVGRSVEFSVPSTYANKVALDFSDDILLYGGMMRKRLEAELLFDGGTEKGLLDVTSYDGDSFKCVFVFSVGQWFDKLQGLKLSDCPTSFNKGVYLGATTQVKDANTADPLLGVDVLRYNNGVNYTPNYWCPRPSLNVYAYIKDVFNLLNCPLDIDWQLLEYWLTAGSIKGGVSELGVKFAQSSLTRVNTTSSLFGIFSFSGSVGLEWADGTFMGALVGGGVKAFNAFFAKEDLKVTFMDIQAGVYLIKHSTRLKRCKCLGGVDAAGIGKPINGIAIELKKNDVIFFADRDGNIDPLAELDGGGDYYGWKNTANVSITANVNTLRDLNYNEMWYLQSNLPDMTLFDFMKSVALAAGLELKVTASGISMSPNEYGTPQFRKSLNDVVSIGEVSRRVSSWGKDTRTARVEYDSEEYVSSRLVSDITIDNEQVSGISAHKIAFSEGDTDSSGNLVIRDVEVDRTAYKFSAKKWTISKVDDASTTLVRVQPYSVIGVDDMAEQSTCVSVRALYSLTDFFGLDDKDVLLMRGIPFVWTGASWSEGVVTLTLQKVSQLKEL